MDSINSLSDLKAIPFYSQFTTEQLTAQLKANALQLRQTSAKAKRTGKKIGGYTWEQWLERAEHFEKIIATETTNKGTYIFKRF